MVLASRHEDACQLVVESIPRPTEDDALAMTRGGKKVMNVKTGAEAVACKFVDGDHVAVIGENRKLIIFPLSEAPELARGQNVMR